MKHIAAGEMKMRGVDVDNNDGRLSSCKRKHKRACQTMISVRLKNLAQHKVMVTTGVVAHTSTRMATTQTSRSLRINAQGRVVRPRTSALGNMYSNFANNIY